MQQTNEPAPLPGYWTFYHAVASTQLMAWLPERPAMVLDLSGSATNATRIADAGHYVIRVADRPDHEPVHRRVSVVVADGAWPAFLADAAVDAIVAEQLSGFLATEAAIEDVARVVRPGGRLLLRVDSLLRGLSRLAEQSCWAQLVDVPSAEVVLVPAPDGTISRCFSPEQLHEALTDAGLEVEWIRPRTVLSPSIVEAALRADPGALPRLVRTELSLEPGRTGETAGIHLVASARRPLASDPEAGAVPSAYRDREA